MTAENGLEARKSEYALRASKVPWQTVDVFAQNPEHGDYGMPAEAADTVFEYAHLQQTLATFDDLTFSPEFVSKLPEDFRKKLGDNLYPGIPLVNLEMPTSDKVLLAQLLMVVM